VAKLMEKCLNSLFRETDLSLDIWVVDNNSDILVSLFLKL
ncbi:unnamed protein product, partial [marine sediment metagenome]